MSKLGEIAYQAYGIRTIGTDADETWRLGWDAAADAVAEECAKVAEDAGCTKPECLECVGRQVAFAIRALKSTDSGEAK